MSSRGTHCVAFFAFEQWFPIGQSSSDKQYNPFSQIKTPKVFAKINENRKITVISMLFEVGFQGLKKQTLTVNT